MRRRSYHVFSQGSRQITCSKSGEGPPLLLIHGLSGSRRWWRRNLPALEPHFTVYRLELAGFGHARRQVPLPPRESAGLIARWMDQAGPNQSALGPAHVLGHSMGGHIGLHLASAHPQRVNRLVLVAATGLLRGEWWRLALRLPRAAVRGKLDFVPVVTTDALRAGVPALYRASRDLLRDDAHALLAGVRSPTLVISGGRDLLVPPALGLELARHLAHAEYLLIAPAGHVVMWDAPQAFNAAVLRFLLADPALADTE